MTSGGEITALLERVAGGDATARSELVERVYAELRRMARRALRDERPGHSLEATALVHEAYLRLLGGPAPRFDGRAHFFAAAARAMRRVLVDHARRARAGKRPPKSLRAPIEAAASTSAPVDVLALDRTLERLAALDQRVASVVELRVFAGLEMAEIAQLLDASPSTVSRDWRMGRAWLRRELSGDPADR